MHLWLKDLPFCFLHVLYLECFSIVVEGKKETGMNHYSSISVTERVGDTSYVSGLCPSTSPGTASWALQRRGWRVGYKGILDKSSCCFSATLGSTTPKKTILKCGGGGHIYIVFFWISWVDNSILYLFGITLSPIIMVQWKMANYLKGNGNDPIGDTPIFDWTMIMGGSVYSIGYHLVILPVELNFCTKKKA